MKFKKLNWPLMMNNITRADRNALISFLKKDEKLTQGEQVESFEKKWSEWLGVKYSVFVNSGANANYLTMNCLRYDLEMRKDEEGEIIIPPLAWISDVASVIRNGFHPVFVDINPRTLGLDEKKVLKAITPKTKAVFITHVMGYSAFTSKDFIEELGARGVILIEDCCEAHGATFKGEKLGTFGYASNFSFYYAHHMSTIEGGMICTNDGFTYERLRMLRSHGMTREIKDEEIRKNSNYAYPVLRPEFIFMYPSFNMRSTELNAVIGLSQLKRLDENNEKRKMNLETFLGNLNCDLFKTDLNTTGSVNYAFTLIMQKPDKILRDKIERLLTLCGVEFRRGLSGGGNQLRQPYLQLYPWDKKDFPVVEHISDFSWYIGNYPELTEVQIKTLCKLLNQFST